MMGFTYRTLVTISDSFRDLLKRQQYEELVLSVLNKSTRLIPNRPLTAVKEQSNGECDYCDVAGVKYDAKLLIDKKQGALIGDRKNDLRDWFKSMMDETAEFTESITRRDLSLVSNSKLYEVMKQRIKSVKTDEIAVLFIPYPVVSDAPGSIFLQFATDFLQAVYDRLNEEKVVTCKKVYFIYPSMQKDIVVLRSAQSRAREYINAPEISKYICFSTSLVKD